MKFLLSSLLLLMLAHPVQEDQNKYLLIYTAKIKPNQFDGSIVLTGTTGNLQYNSGGQYNLSSSYYEYRNQVFSSLEDAQNFIHDHTVHYLDENSRTEPWDFMIIDITGFYKLQKLGSEKHQSGTHTEYVTSTQEVKLPSYEWSINE